MGFQSVPKCWQIKLHSSFKVFLRALSDKEDFVSLERLGLITPAIRSAQHYHSEASDQESHFSGSLCCCSQVFIERYNICTMDKGFYVQALLILCAWVCVCLCVCRHLVCGSVEQASVEEDLLLVALTPLQMSHSFLPSPAWERETERGRRWKWLWVCL